jgi:DNA-binding beta-propeller fold protein YncE
MDEVKDAGFPVFSMLAPLGFLALLSPAQPRIAAGPSGTAFLEAARSGEAIIVAGEVEANILPTRTPSTWYEADEVETPHAGLEAVPEGVAIDPNNDHIFVTDKETGSVRLLTEAGCPILIDKRTPIYSAANPGRQRAAPLRNPGKLDFVADHAGGTLYVTENTPESRQLAFRIREGGRPSSGTVCQNAAIMGGTPIAKMGIRPR